MNKLYKALSFKIKDSIEICVNEKKYKGKKIQTINSTEFVSKTIRIKESELIRILNHLTENKYGDELQKELILLQVKTKKYETEILNEEVINKISDVGQRYLELNNGEIDIVFYDKEFIYDENCAAVLGENGFHKYNKINIEKITYKRLMSSPGNLRNGKIVFVKKEMYEKVLEIILCGIDKNKNFDKISKFNAYISLSSTDSNPVSMPRICVIKDFNTIITDKFDIVKEIGKDEYKVENNVIKEVSINAFDGAGLVSNEMASIWSKELNMDYIASSYKPIVIGGIKGNLYTFPIHEYAKDNGVSEIIDCYGKYHNIEDIDVILTESQFKFKNEYKDIEDFIFKFNTVSFGYKRTFNICKVSVNNKKLSKTTNLAYQPIQSLNLNKDEITELCGATINQIKLIKTDYKAFIKFRGIDKFSKDEYMPPYYKALAINNELFFDPYIQDKAKQDIKGCIDKACEGKVVVSGNYQNWIPDLIALAEHSMGFNPVGFLKKGQIYSKFWVDKNVSEVDIIRFPHIYQEHAVRNVVNTTNKYLKYNTEGIITNIYDSTAMRLNGSDFDGDIVLTTDNKIILNAAKKDILENNSNTILFEESISKKQVKSASSQDINELIKIDVLGMQSNIGGVVNAITKLWNIEITEEIRNYIKIMSVVGSLTIDFAKTGVAAKVPTEIKNKIHSIKKPYFMRYVYNELIIKEKNRNKINSLIGNQEDFKSTNEFESTMNILCKHIEDQMRKISFKYESENSFNYNILLSDNKNLERLDRNKTYKTVFLEVINIQRNYIKLSIKNNVNKIDIHNFNEFAKTSLLQCCIDEEKLLDYIINILYCEKEYCMHNESKSILWNCFSELILNRLSGNKKSNNYDIDKIIIKNKKLKDKISKNNSKFDKKIINFENAALSKSDVKFIRENILKSKFEERKILSLLMVLEKTNNNIIYLQEKSKITENYISLLLKIDRRKLRTIINGLKELELITIKKNDSNSYIININLEYGNSNDVTIENIDNMKKLYNILKK